jgi:hypothetical protein
LRNGNYLVLARSIDTRTDYLREITRSGKTAWEWQSATAVSRHFPDADLSADDPTHLNSVDELPANSWYASGDSRFRPGNILLSARNLNAVFIIDRKTGDIVWSFDDGLDYQHAATMVPEGQIGAGLIVLFNNGYNNIAAYRRSSIMAIDPVAGKVVWDFSTDGFYSSVAGSQVSLPNGNVLISSSEGGRAFEVNLKGDLVWEWIPPFLPMRVERYPLDHCPQLAELELAAQSEVPPAKRPPFIDIELFSFSIPGEYDFRELPNGRWAVLPVLDGCRELWFPDRPTVLFAYGFDEGPLGDAELTARFVATIGETGSEERATLIDDVVSTASGSRLRDQRMSLPDYAYKRVSLCLSVEWDGSLDQAQARDSIIWARPKVTGPSLRYHHTARPDHTLTAQEQDLEAKQLQALGYVH